MADLFEILSYRLNEYGTGFVVGVDTTDISDDSRRFGYFNFIVDKTIGMIDEPADSYWVFDADSSDGAYNFAVDVYEGRLDLRNTFVVISGFEYWENASIGGISKFLSQAEDLGAIVIIKDPLGSIFESNLSVIA